jgi:hypothetical protein
LIICQHFRRSARPPLAPFLRKLLLCGVVLEHAGLVRRCSASDTFDRAKVVPAKKEREGESSIV